MNKKLLLGVDEAGYGPNLGPLVLAASAWLVPEELTEQEFCELMGQHFRPRNWHAECDYIPLGDSKKLYHSGSGLDTLEMGLLVMLRLLKFQPANLQALLERVSVESITQEEIAALPWYESMAEVNIPGSGLERSELERLSQLALDSLAALHIELIDIASVVVTEVQFNLQVQELGSKGQFLSQATLALVAEMLARHPGYRAEIFCDRQGGRKNYLPILLGSMPDHWFIETAVSDRRCSYRTSSQPELEIHFSVGGDSFPPAGLASMLAKYLRERCMECFNAFWAQHTVNLKPTAGYPVDAQRFRRDIEAAAQLLALTPENWWRCR